MVRVININKAKQATRGPPQKTFGKPQERPTIEAAPKPPLPPAKQNFISRFLDIMVYDIMHKLHMVPDKPENIIENKVDLEKYEEFCRIARGGK